MYGTVLYIEASQSHWVEVGYRGGDISDRGAEIVRRLHALANAMKYNISALVSAGVEGVQIQAQQQKTYSTGGENECLKMTKRNH